MFNTYKKVSYGNSFLGESAEKYIDYNGNIINQRSKQSKNEIVY